MNKGMKKWFFGMCALLMITSCKDDTTNPPSPVSFSGLRYASQGTLTLSIDHTFNAMPVVRFAEYVTPLGDTVSIDQLRYYISNVQLRNSEGSWVNLGNYHLVGIEDASSGQISLGNIPAGTYDRMRFLVGVDSVSNHSGAQEGALSPINDMFWEWATGYVFFRLKGSFNSGKAMALDLGGDANLPVAEFDLGSYRKEGNAFTVKLSCRAEEVFVSPHNYDLKVQPSSIHTPNSPGAPLLRDNIANGVFVIGSVQ